MNKYACIIALFLLFFLFRKRTTRSHRAHWWSTEWNWQVCCWASL